MENVQYEGNNVKKRKKVLSLISFIVFMITPVTYLFAFSLPFIWFALPKLIHLDLEGFAYLSGFGYLPTILIALVAIILAIVGLKKSDDFRVFGIISISLSVLQIGVSAATGIASFLFFILFACIGAMG